MSGIMSSQQPLEALTKSTEDLLNMAEQGRLRLPTFQRTWKWKKEQVKNLFDSLLRGFPAGTLLMWTRAVEAGPIRFGDGNYGVTLPGPKLENAWFIVDGQQRLTSLVGTLLHAAQGQATDPNDPFALYFDLERETFEHPQRHQGRPAHWLPVWVLGDSLRVLDWQNAYPTGPNSRAHIRLAHRVTKAIREYRWPVYIVSHYDEELVRTIFDRTNNGGTPLKKEEIFRSLYSARDDFKEADLTTLQEGLVGKGFGEIPEGWLLKTVVALADGDLSRLDDQLRKQDDVRAALEDAGPVLERALEFLRADVGIAHLSLLPYRMPLPVLARFFKAHGLDQSLSLDVRASLALWLWRGAASGAHQGTSALTRQALGAIADHSLEESIDGLLAQVAEPALPFDLGRYDFRRAATKLGCNALLSLGPVDLRDGTPIDIGALLEQEGAGAFRQIVRDKRYLPDDADDSAIDLLYRLANRMFHPIEQGNSPWSLLQGIAAQYEGRWSDPELASRLATHAIEPGDLRALAQRDASAFLEARSSRIRALVDEWIRARTAAPTADDPADAPPTAEGVQA